MDPARITPSPPEECDLDELREALVAGAVKGNTHDITTALMMVRAAVAAMSTEDVREAARHMDAEDPEGAARRMEKNKLRLRGVCNADCYLCWPGLDTHGQPTTQTCGNCGRDSIYVSVGGCQCPGCERDVCAYCHGHPYTHGYVPPAGAADDAACKRCCKSCDPENGNYAHPVPALVGW